MSEETQKLFEFGEAPAQFRGIKLTYDRLNKMRKSGLKTITIGRRRTCIDWINEFMESKVDAVPATEVKQ